VGYDLRRKAKPEDWLTEEEEDVRHALSEYTANPLKVNARDFVPTQVLYGVYRRWVAQFVRYPDDPDTLSLRQFGAAFLRVFPDLDDYDPEIGRNPNQVRRMYHGQQLWGYMGLRGPLSVRSHIMPGRPPHDVGDPYDE
jgi:hypothetical protein